MASINHRSNKVVIYETTDKHTYTDTLKPETYNIWVLKKVTIQESFIHQKNQNDDSCHVENATTYN